MRNVKWIWSPILATSLTAMSPAWGQANSGYYGPGMMWDRGWFGMLFGPLVMIFFFIAVIVLVVAVIRWLTGPSAHHHTSPAPPAGKTALDILKERFARGEIDKDEFEEKKKLLSD